MLLMAVEDSAAARNNPTQGLSPTYEQAHVGLDLLILASRKY